MNSVTQSGWDRYVGRDPVEMLTDRISPDRINFRAVSGVIGSSSATPFGSSQLSAVHLS